MSDAHLLEFPYFNALANARLDRLYHDEAQSELVLDFHELQLENPPEMIWQNGKPYEKVTGLYVPRRLRFRGVKWIECKGVYANLDETPLDHSARYTQGALYWKPASKEEKLWMLLASSSDFAKLLLTPQEIDLEECDGDTEVANLTRNWSPTPPWSEQMMSEASTQELEFGGDAIRFLLNGEMCESNFFVGGTHNQGAQRPPVHAILNLSEEPSAWLHDSTIPPFDRWSLKNEGQDGMTSDEMIIEAQWVMKRLKEGQRVLVHCSAGFNRSVTVCCAVLILLEKMSAEEALSRVREQHPWARPDAYNWLKLKWLAHSRKEQV